MFEELLKCLSEIYAGVEQKITEMNELKAENARLHDEIANHVCECNHEEELAQAKAEVEAAKAEAEEAKAAAEAAKAEVEAVKAEHAAQLGVLRKEFEELRDLLFPVVEPEEGGDDVVEPEEGGDDVVEPEEGGDEVVEPEEGGDEVVEPEEGTEE